MTEKIKVSILCVTYNQARFIRQALDGFMMQKTDFAFEVLVHDDASTDGTADIVREYAQRYPEVIKPVFQVENQFSKGVNVDKTYNWPRIQGEYVAICDGDDYWTDEHKLQKQVKFLDAHPDFSICFHRAKVIWDDNSHKSYISPKAKMRFHRRVLKLSHLLKCNFIQSSSVMYRWRLKGQENLCPDGILPVDYFLHLLHAEAGKIGYLPDVMSVYRRNDGGIFTGAGQSDTWFLKCALKHMAFYEAVENEFQCNKKAEMASMFKKAAFTFLIYQDWEQLKVLGSKYADKLDVKSYDDDLKLKKCQKKNRRLKKILIIVCYMLLLSIIGIIIK